MGEKGIIGEVCRSGTDFDATLGDETIGRFMTII